MGVGLSSQLLGSGPSPPSPSVHLRPPRLCTGCFLSIRPWSRDAGAFSKRKLGTYSLQRKQCTSRENRRETWRSGLF